MGGWGVGRLGMRCPCGDDGCRVPRGLEDGYHPRESLTPYPMHCNALGLGLGPLYPRRETASIWMIC